MGTKHCWAECEEGEATCLLEDGHEGPHEWTPDNEIMITFKGKGEG